MMQIVNAVKRIGLLEIISRILEDLGFNSVDLPAMRDHLAFNWRNRSALYRHMAIQIDNNIGRILALEKFHKKMVRKKNTRVAAIIADMIRRTNNGDELHMAMRRWIPIDESLLIAGGESAGNVAQAFVLICAAKERITKIRRAMIASFITPIVYLVALYGVVWAIGIFFCPVLTTLVPVDRLVGMGALLYYMGVAATSYWMVIPLLLLVVSFLWLKWALPNWTGAYRTKFEEYYPFNFYRDIGGYVWLLTFASMLRAGMSDTKILGDQSLQATPWMRQRLTLVRQRMVNGDSLAEALMGTKLGFPNPDLIDDIESMSGFTDFPERISERTNKWADEIEWTTSTRVKITGFAFDMVMYAIILFVLVGINSLSTQMGTIPNT